MMAACLTSTRPADCQLRPTCNAITNTGSAPRRSRPTTSLVLQQAGQMLRHMLSGTCWQAGGWAALDPEHMGMRA